MDLYHFSESVAQISSFNQPFTAYLHVHPREQTSDIPGMNGEPEVEQHFVLLLFIVRTRRPHSEN